MRPCRTRHVRRSWTSPKTSPGWPHTPARPSGCTRGAGIRESATAKDLLQILWCPNHDALFPDASISVHWRRAADVTDVLTDPPTPHTAEDGMVPFPELEDWDVVYPAYPYGLSIASGCKLGGGMSWELTDMGDPPKCDECGSEARSAGARSRTPIWTTTPTERRSNRPACR